MEQKYIAIHICLDSKSLNPWIAFGLQRCFNREYRSLSWTYRIGFSSDDTRTGGAQIIEFRLKGCFRDGVSRVVSLSQLICQASLAYPSLFPPPECSPCRTRPLSSSLVRLRRLEKHCRIIPRCFARRFARFAFVPSCTSHTLRRVAMPRYYATQRLFWLCRDKRNNRQRTEEMFRDESNVSWGNFNKWKYYVVKIVNFFCK